MVVVTVSLLPFCPLSTTISVIVLGSRWDDREILGRGFDEVERKNYVEGVVHNHFEDFIKTNETVIDH